MLFIGRILDDCCVYISKPLEVQNMNINIFHLFLTAVTTFVNREFIILLRSITTQVSTELLLYHSCPNRFSSNVTCY